MMVALEEAKLAAKQDEVPVGAVLVDVLKSKIVAKAGNRVKEDNNPIAHAELLVLQMANVTHLFNMDLYVTLEPCTMCAAALSLARVRRIYFGAYDPKAGAIEHGVRFFDQPSCHHKPEIYGGIYESEAKKLLKSFFLNKRNKVQGFY
ncbi:MAG: nucleoside deaminase [Alphaproteobacteria bacterium]|nr:nucleoside deaminase [Alphaproteobacteria bacterium]